MLVPSFDTRDEPSELRPERRFKRSQVLLVGFDQATDRILSGYLSALSLKFQSSADPYSGLAALIDEPGAWMTCIVNARAFASRSELERFVRLFAFEGESVGMILANAQAGTIELLAPTRGVNGVTGNITDPRAFRSAIATVMEQRGYPMSARSMAAELIDFEMARSRAPLPPAASQAVMAPSGKGEPGHAPAQCGAVAQA